MANTTVKINRVPIIDNNPFADSKQINQKTKV
jgi:hypothetical protein